MRKDWQGGPAADRLRSPAYTHATSFSGSGFCSARSSAIASAIIASIGLERIPLWN
jgi:hypothetical protein